MLHAMRVKSLNHLKYVLTLLAKYSKKTTLWLCSIYLAVYMTVTLSILE